MSIDADEALLERLGAALAPAEVEPHPTEIAALRRLIAGDSLAHGTVLAIGRRRNRIVHRLAVAATVAALAVAGSAVAFAAGVPMPRPVRGAAHTLGLPVDSPSLSDAKEAVSSLRVALRDGEDAEIERAAVILRQRLRDLHGDERGDVAGADQLLARADRRLHHDDGPNSDPRTGEGTQGQQDGPVSADDSRTDTGQGRTDEPAVPEPPVSAPGGSGTSSQHGPAAGGSGPSGPPGSNLNEAGSSGNSGPSGAQGDAESP